MTTTTQTDVNAGARRELARRVDAMLGRCDGARNLDGVGFNSYDSPYVRQLAARTAAGWTSRDMAALRTLLGKYRRQLEEMGLPYDAIPAVVHEQVKDASKARTVRAGRLRGVDGYMIRFPYDEGLKNDLKVSLRRRSWVPVDEGGPSWFVPDEPGATHDLVRWLDGKGFDVESSAWAALLERTAEGDLPARAIILSGDGRSFGIRFGGMSREQFIDCLDDLKAVEGRTWDPTTRTNWVPVDEWALAGLAGFAEKWQFEPTPDAARALADLEGIRREGDAWHERSAAADAHAPELDGFVSRKGDVAYPFQRAGILFARDAGSCIIGDEVGLGKTIQAYGVGWLTDGFPMVVVCQSTKKSDWAMEAFAWLPGRRVAVIEGTKPVRLGAHDVYIINFDVLHAHVDRLAALRPRVLAFDEAQYIKEKGSRRTKAALALAAASERVLCLTGTPLLNGPVELVPLLLATKRLHHFAGSEAEFKRRWCNATIKVFGTGANQRRVLDASGSTNEAALHERLRRSGTMIRRLKADVLTELPPLLAPKVIPLPIDNRDEYRVAEERFLDWVRDQALTNDAYIAKHRREVEDDAAFMARLDGLADADRETAIREELAERRQASASRAAAMAQIGALKQVAARGIVRPVVEWIRRFTAGGEKLIVFAHHQEIQNAIAEAFPGCARIMGGAEGKAHNDAWKKRFQTDPDCRIIVCSMMAASTGHTLTAAANTLHVELGWTPADQTQGFGRAHRIGQHRPVQPWIAYASETIYEYVVNLLAEKSERVDAITDGKAMGGEDSGSILSGLMEAARVMAGTA